MVYRTPASSKVEKRAQQSIFKRLLSWTLSVFDPLLKYLHHPTAVASIALSVLYFTVLSFGPQMITYLLSVGFNSRYVGLLRTFSVVFELSATWLAPMATKRAGVLRAGLWFINWQMIWLGAAVGAFWWITHPILAALCLTVGVMLSRVGLWGFDLCAQLVIQEVRVFTIPCFPHKIID